MLGLVTPAGLRFEERAHDVGRRARGQVHRTAQSFGLVIGQGGLVDDKTVDRTGGDGVVFHRSAAAAEIGAPRIGVEQRDAAKCRAGQVAVYAADVHEAAFAGVGGNRHARDAAQRLGGVEVRILLDGLGGLDIDDVRRGELDLARHLLLAGRRHHHAGDLAGRRCRLAVGLGRQHEQARSRQDVMEVFLHRCSLPRSGAARRAGPSERVSPRPRDWPHGFDAAVTAR